MTVRRPFAAVALTLMVAAACSKVRPAPVATPATWPAQFTFTATTGLDSVMQATFEGSATFAEGWLTVAVPRATLIVPPGNPENWRNLTVRAFVATDYQPGNWRAMAQTRPVNVFRFIDFGATKWSERRTVAIEHPLTFQVPIPKGASSATSRLAFELEWVFVMGTFGDTDSRVAFSGPIAMTPFR